MQPSTEYIDYDIDESDISDIFPMIPIGKWEIYKYDDTEEMRFRLKIIPKLESCLGSIVNISVTLTKYGS